MEKIVLKTEIMDKINTDPILFGKLAVALGISSYSLPRILRSHSAKLTQANVLKVLADHLGEQDTALFLETQAIPQV